MKRVIIYLLLWVLFSGLAGQVAAQEGAGSAANGDKKGDVSAESSPPPSPNASINARSTPDTYGYAYADSASTGGPTYNFETLGSPIALSLTDDSLSGLLSLGFDFNFYGTTYTGLYVSSNGFLSFTGDTNGCCSGVAIPTAGVPDGYIAGWWNDLYPPGGGSVRYQTVGTAPNRRFIVEFNSVPHCCGTSNPTSMQFKLFEGSNNIEVHYAAAPVAPNAAAHTAGLEAPGGTLGLQYQFTTAALVTPLAVRYYAPTPFTESFEAGFGNWTMSGLWNSEAQTDNCGALRAPFPSATNAAWYGVQAVCTFNNGATNSGSLTMNFDVPIPTWATAATITYRSFEQTECGFGNCGYDARYIDVSADGGATWPTRIAAGATESAWYTPSFSLVGSIGQLIRIRFTFESGDNIGNDFFGWMVDNIRLNYTAGSCTTVGYYDMTLGAGNTNQAGPITTAGKTAMSLADVAAANLQGIDVLFVQNPDNGLYGAEYLSRLTDIRNAVSKGMVLIIHDRYVDGAESILPGGSNFTVVRDFADGANINIRDNSTKVTSGPGGTLSDTSLDGGSSSSHGYTAASSLPQNAQLVLTRGNSSEIVTFSYTFGLGKVIYSSIPLDYYLDGSAPLAFRDIYAPNIIAFACDISVTPVTIASFSAQPAGSGARFTWSTATETANAGFNLYVETPNGLRRINDRLIPSQTVNSVTPRSYTFSAEDVKGDTFYIEDVSIRQERRQHGPFQLGESYGQDITLERIDWARIQAEQAAFTAQEQAARLPAIQTAFDARRPDMAVNGKGQLNLRVNQTGLQRVTYQDFVDFGLDPSHVMPQRVALLNQGQPAPINLVLSGGVFGPGSYIEFYGQGVDTLYTATNIYTLTLDPALARRVAQDRTPVPNGAPATFYLDTVHVENENGYSFLTPNGDPWYDTLMTAYGSPFSQDFTFEIDHYQPGAATPTLTVEVWGLTEWEAYPDHRLQVSLNGVSLADESFDGFVNHPISLALPPNVLQNGTNTLRLTIPPQAGVDWDMIYLNAYSVTYPRAFAARQNTLAFTAQGPLFEVSGLKSPQVTVYRLDDGGPTWLRKLRVTPDGGSYRVAFAGLPDRRAGYVVAAAGAMGSPALAAAQPYTDITSGAADYLIIAHPSFISGLTPLVQFHQAQGLTVKVVNVKDVYAQFSGGVFDPQAIKAYLTHAIQNMGVQYILLVGGDTYDYRNYLGLDSISFIPSLYAGVGPYPGFTPVDPQYTDVDNNNVPDAAIGRWPVRDSAELSRMIQKTLAYAGKNYGRSVLMAADAAQNGDSFTDTAEALLAQLSPTWNAERAYLDVLGVGAARDLLLNTLNNGVALTNYVGHSGPSSWTFAGLFQASDAAALTNHGRPTVVTQWGCWNTYYVDPMYNTLAHKFLLSGDQGAAAVLGATSITETTSDTALGLRLLPLATQPGMSLGMAIQEAKTSLAQSEPGMSDVILGWTLLGDPAMVVEP